jgi:hypothetical protein
MSQADRSWGRLTAIWAAKARHLLTTAARFRPDVAERRRDNAWAFGRAKPKAPKQDRPPKKPKQPKGKKD